MTTTKESKYDKFTTETYYVISETKIKKETYKVLGRTTDGRLRVIKANWAGRRSESWVRSYYKSYAEALDALKLIVEAEKRKASDSLLFWDDVWHKAANAATEEKEK